MYDNYIAVDWSQRNMAIARMTQISDRITTIDVPSDVRELQLYLDRLRGTKVVCIEETSTAQWLYVELKDHCDELIVCDPYRNHLLCEGAKNDRIDAEKLVKLLRSNLLKPVFHAWDEGFYMRKLVSGYDDVVKSGVRMQNQRSALIRAAGAQSSEELKHKHECFILDGIDRRINQYREEKQKYEDEFEKLRKQHIRIRNLASIPGIGTINAVKIVACVIEPKRFSTKGRFLAYCGLIKHDKLSGGRSYGKRVPRYSRSMKCVFKTAVAVCLSKEAANPVRSYFEFLLTTKNYGEHNARHAVCRHVAILAWGILKRGKKFDERRWGPGKFKNNS